MPSLSFFFLLHRRHPLLLPTLSPRAITGILDTAIIPALSLLSSLAVNPVVFSLNATASPLSPLFLLHQPISSRFHSHGPSFPHLFTHDPRGSLFAGDHGCRLSSFFLLIVFLCFLTTSTTTAFLSYLSTIGPRRRPWFFTVVVPSSASSSLFADDQTTAPYSSFFCVFSTSVAIVAAVRHLPFPLLLRFPNATAPICSLPHLLSFFSSAPLLTSLSTLAIAVAAAVRPRLSSFSSFLYSATTDCRLCCRRRSHPSLPPSLFFSCRHRLIFRRSPPPTTLTSAPPDLVYKTPPQSPLRACKPLIFEKVFLHRVQDGLHYTWGFARAFR